MEETQGGATASGADGLFDWLGPRDKQHLLMWWLLGGGVLLVCLAAPLGPALAPKTQYAPGAYQWSADSAREITLVLRILGVMGFAAGLAERVLLGIRSAAEGHA